MLLNPKERVFRGEEGRKLFDLAKCKNIEVIFDPDSKELEGKTETEVNDLWLEARKGYVDEKGKKHYCVGGSDQAIIQGVSPFSNNQDLFKIKTGKIASSMDLNNPNNVFRLEFGHAVEEAVILGYLCLHPEDKIIIDKRTFRRTDKPWLIFDVDGIILYADGEVGIFECKTTSYYNKTEWEKVPPHYMCQLQHYMGGFNLKRATIACCWGNNLSSDFVYFEERANKAYINRIFEDSRRFVECCEKDEEPELEACFDNPDVALKSLQNYFAELKSQPIAAMPVKDKELIAEIVTAKEELDIVEKKKKELENLLKFKSIPILTEIKDRGAKLGVYNYDGKSLTIGYSGRKMNQVNVPLLKSKFPVLADSLIKESVSVTDLRASGNLAAIAECMEKRESKPSFKVEVKENKDE